MAWFKGDAYSYKIDCRRPNRLVASDGSVIKCKNIAKCLEDHCDPMTFAGFADNYELPFEDYITPAASSLLRKKPTEEKVEEDVETTDMSETDGNQVKSPVQQAEQQKDKAMTRTDIDVDQKEDQVCDVGAECESDDKEQIQPNDGQPSEPKLPDYMGKGVYEGRWRKLSENYDDEDYVIQVDDWKLVEDEDRDDDVSKIWHHAINVKTGEKVFIDWTPYSHMSRADLHLWLKCGMPSRGDLNSIGPIHRDHLIKFALERGVNEGRIIRGRR